MKVLSSNEMNEGNESVLRVLTEVEIESVVGGYCFWDSNRGVYECTF